MAYIEIYVAFLNKRKQETSLCIGNVLRKVSKFGSGSFLLL